MTQFALRTIQNPVEHLLKEKGSKFLCLAEPVSSKHLAESVIQNVRVKYFDATHHCYAYSIGSGSEKIFRFNDDGEPSGTAGKPILQAITSRRLSQLIVIVVRYFGGTKLGTGGLIRAYGGVAAQTLDKAEIVTTYLTEQLDLQFSYSLLHLVETAVQKFRVQIVESSFESGIRFIVSVRKDFVAPFTEFVRNGSSDNVIFTAKGEGE
ncbi:YigZ family protein [candidate division KSB1 bacterium]|nr:YigZ family protein [candidate division KSB1 bacterium]